MNDTFSELLEPDTGSVQLQTELATVSINRSAHVGDLMIALAKAQGEYDKAVKDADNPYYGSKYADLASITGAVRGAFSKHGIAIVQTVTADLERQTAGATTFLYFGEQWISTTCELPAVGKAKDGKDRFDAQTIGAAQTYARRYTLAPLASVAPEDDDANTIVRDDARKFGKPAPAPQAAQRAAQAPARGNAPPQAASPATVPQGADKAAQNNFLTQAKEKGWGLAAVRTLLTKKYGNFAIGTLTSEQIAECVAIMGKGQPDEVLAEMDDTQPTQKGSSV
jgi:hypothetical protein